MDHRAMTLFHRRQILGRSPDQMIGLAFPPLEKTGVEKNNIMRWEDDGGSVIELETPYPQTGVKDTTPLMLVRVVRTHKRIRIGEIQ